MPQIDQPTLLQAVADSMQLKSVTLLGPQWGNICTMAVDDGYKDIATIMIGKGYSETDVLAWDRLTSFHRLQSLYYAFVHGAGLHNFDDRWVNKLDQRDALRSPDMAITSSGGIVQGTGNPGFVQAGVLDTTNDRWTRDTPV